MSGNRLACERYVKTLSMYGEELMKHSIRGSRGKDLARLMEVGESRVGEKVVFS